MRATPASPGFVRAAWRLARPYWSSDERWSARGLLAVVVAMNLALVYLNVLFNQWNNAFYTALQDYDGAGFLHQMLRFSWLAALYILTAGYQIYLNQLLRLRWRRWMTDRLLGHYLHDQSYYRLQLGDGATDNPDQRIAQDINEFVDSGLILSVGLLKTLVNLASFLVILWSLSGTVTLPLGDWSLMIPGYLVWVALVYAGVGTWLTHRVGRPLIGLNFQQQRFEADYRFSLMRLREHALAIAAYGGEGFERGQLGARFALIIGNFRAIMRRNKNLTFLGAGYDQIAAVFPFIVVAPRYFAKQIELGTMMQTVSAFSEVKNSLSFVVDSYAEIARWRSVVDRLTGFEAALGDLARRGAAGPRPTVVINHGEQLATERLRLYLPDGTVLRGPLDLAFEAGRSVLLTAPSGWGKSTLLRALAGVWPYADGTIIRPESRSLCLVPQQPYLPLGTLEAVLGYPYAPGTFACAQLTGALALVDLEALSGRLDEERQWAQQLSLGEQQRIAFARLLLQRPGWVLLDEASSALDEPAEAELYSVLLRALPTTTIISVGHRSSLTRFHQRVLDLSAGTDLAAVSPI